MARDSQNTASIFDYLYIDHVRIASYLGQLSDHGHLNSTVVEDRTKNSVASKFEAGVSAVGEFRMGFGDNAGSESSAARTYDTLWTNARSILDVLDEEGLIGHDLSNAALGRIVAASGSLSISDLRVLRPMWAPMVSLMGDQIEVPDQFRNRQQRRAEKGKRKPSTAPVEDSAKGTFLEVMATFLGGMPHTVQGTIEGEAGSVWFTMTPSRMSPSPEELALEHGDVVPGVWHVIGVVDAMPGPVTLGGAGAGAAAVTQPFMAQVREQFGRPDAAYGVTPLMVFRKLDTGAAAADDGHDEGDEETG